MLATVTDLKEYKAAHPIGLRIFNNAVRCWWNWYSLPFVMMAKYGNR